MFKFSLSLLICLFLFPLSSFSLNYDDYVKKNNVKEESIGSIISEYKVGKLNERSAKRKLKPLVTAEVEMLKIYDHDRGISKKEMVENKIKFYLGIVDKDKTIKNVISGNLSTAPKFISMNSVTGVNAVMANQSVNVENNFSSIVFRKDVGGYRSKADYSSKSDSYSSPGSISVED